MSQTYDRINEAETVKSEEQAPLLFNLGVLRDSEPLMVEYKCPILYLCDQTYCKTCHYPECRYTADINHAKNKDKVHTIQLIAEQNPTTKKFYLREKD